MYSLMYCSMVVSTSCNRVSSCSAKSVSVSLSIMIAGINTLSFAGISLVSRNRFSASS